MKPDFTPLKQTFPQSYDAEANEDPQNRHHHVSMRAKEKGRRLRRSLASPC
jgi:hypothetical protein